MVEPVRAGHLPALLNISEHPCWMGPSVRGPVEGDGRSTKPLVRCVG
jgi:hypothetical protein